MGCASHHHTSLVHFTMFTHSHTNQFERDLNPQPHEPQSICTIPHDALPVHLKCVWKKEKNKRSRSASRWQRSLSTFESLNSLLFLFISSVPAFTARVLIDIKAIIQIVFQLSKQKWILLCRNGPCLKRSSVCVCVARQHGKCALVCVCHCWCCLPQMSANIGL